ncbi:MAG: Thioredoxin reductase [Rhizobacter sp.]|nr:Thioredoxin reductase [Rhizobacter sp.]
MTDPTIDPNASTSAADAPAHSLADSPAVAARGSADEEMEPDDPYARTAQTYPALSPSMVDRIGGYGNQESLTKGQVLFERGQRHVDFFVVKRGAIEMFDTGRHGETHVVTVHGERQFSGELDQLNGRQVLVSARVAQDGEAIRLKRADFARMLTAESDIGEIILRSFILRRVGSIRHPSGSVLVVGSGHDGDTLRLQRFMGRNGYPFQLVDVDSPEVAAEFNSMCTITPEQLPVVLLPNSPALFNPTNAALADALGLTEPFDSTHVYDVIVVGAGPSGLAAAVYAASEGLDTLVIENMAPGGQAGTSSKIENYLGFPTGISGLALAGRAQVQAQKFGARLAISRAVLSIDCKEQPFALHLEDDHVVRARGVIVASGARYRTLDVPERERFEGHGLHYAATPMERQLCAREEVIVVGGGNSAGQAAVFLSRTVSHVHMLIRSGGLAATMSDYLVQRIQSTPNITLHTRTEISKLEGDHLLRQVTWRNRDSGEASCHEIGNVFVMVGAAPNTEWLDGCVKLDRTGFIVTGVDEAGKPLASPFATTLPGVWAVGDVRSGSVKRVASGVGEGSVVVQSVHAHLNPTNT